jgi:DNA-binding FadR family transcriptional regulator
MSPVTKPRTRHQSPSNAPSFNGAFDRLLVAITSGRFAPGTHLPPERDLARELGASRPTLREALRRLAEWGMVAARRGSGVVVREIDAWSIDALPAYLRSGAAYEQRGAAVTMIRDVLDMRRIVLLDIVRLVAPRMRPGALVHARAAVERAWAARGDAAAFVHEDFELVRSIAMAARFLPGVWMLNGLARMYFDLARTVTAVGVVPDDYLESYGVILDALERNDGDAASAALAAYFERHDQRLLAALEMLS